MFLVLKLTSNSLSKILHRSLDDEEEADEAMSEQNQKNRYNVYMIFKELMP
jgi:hypothetical protein